MAQKWCKKQAVYTRASVVAWNYTGQRSTKETRTENREERASVLQAELCLVGSKAVVGIEYTRLLPRAHRHSVLRVTEEDGRDGSGRQTQARDDVAPICSCDGWFDAAQAWRRSTADGAGTGVGGNSRTPSLGRRVNRLGAHGCTKSTGSRQGASQRVVERPEGALTMPLRLRAGWPDGPRIRGSGW